MYELKVTSGFAAAHRLTMVGAKCENLHGHNWKVEVVLQGDRLDEGRVLLDFGVVKTHLREVMATLDHKFLNELPMFAGEQPSSERIAAYVARGYFYNATARTVSGYVGMIFRRDPVLQMPEDTLSRLPALRPFLDDADLLGTTLDSTKMFMPTGGVIRLISITQTTRMPNQTGSKPSAVTSGKKIGTVSSIIDRLSIAVPSST